MAASVAQLLVSAALGAVGAVATAGLTGVMVGPPGKDGLDGRDAKDGKAGQDGKDGAPGEPGAHGSQFYPIMGAPGPSTPGLGAVVEGAVAIDRETGNMYRRNGSRQWVQILKHDEIEHDFEMPQHFSGRMSIVPMDYPLTVLDVSDRPYFEPEYVDPPVASICGMPSDMSSYRITDELKRLPAKLEDIDNRPVHLAGINRGYNGQLLFVKNDIVVSAETQNPDEPENLEAVITMVYPNVRIFASYADRFKANGDATEATETPAVVSVNAIRSASSSVDLPYGAVAMFVYYDNGINDRHWRLTSVSPGAEAAIGESKLSRTGLYLPRSSPIPSDPDSPEEEPIESQTPLTGHEVIDIAIGPILGCTLSDPVGEPNAVLARLGTMLSVFIPPLTLTGTAAAPDISAYVVLEAVPTRFQSHSVRFHAVSPISSSVENGSAPDFDGAKAAFVVDGAQIRLHLAAPLATEDPPETLNFPGTIIPLVL